MINGLIGWCLRNTFLIGIAVVFIILGGYYAITNSPVDAIPDIGEKQVIVYADWEGRSPQDVDNQVTFPLTTGLTGTPGVKSIRSMSGFGFSMVFVIFDDDVDFYWARSRVLERMNVAQQRLPDGVTPVLAPDATALGQVYWYTLEGEGFDLAELRSIQDWYLRYQLNAVPGVSEVASVGGFVKQYQIDVHPDKMRAHRVSLFDVLTAVQNANIDVGAKAIEKNGVEFFIRGRGFLRDVEDLEKVVIRQEEGTPIQIRHVATVTLGPDFRRGALDKNGMEAVGGVVVMRYGENARDVVARVKEKLKQLEAGLPEKTFADGTTVKPTIVPFYDRGDIVEETINTLKTALTEELLMAAAVILIFMLHLRSTVSVIITLPLSVAICFMLMYGFGVDSNIMSLAGLAIAIGDVADMGIIMTENIYRHIATGKPGRSYFQKVYDGATEVGGAIVTAVSNTLVSFIPVFFLAGQEGKMFRPLAFTKTFAIGGSVLLALTVVPVVCLLLFRPVKLKLSITWAFALILGAISAVATHFVFQRYAGVGTASGWPMAIAAGFIVTFAIVRIARERFLPLEQNLASRAVLRVYEPVLGWILNHKKTFMLVPLVLVFIGLSVWLGIGTTLAPLEIVINQSGNESIPADLKREMYLPPDSDVPRPVVEFDHVVWQQVRQPDGDKDQRLLWRRQSSEDREKELAAGVEVVREKRILPGIGREFLPPLDEGSFLYMPSLLPHGGLIEAIEVSKKQDLAIASVPEVASVVGKVGRSDSALDPAPVGMMESIVILKPEDEWRRVPVKRWFSDWPDWAKAPLLLVAPEERNITKQEILAEMQSKAAIPGVLPTWLQPIQTRLVMLQTGFRAMMGVKIFGSDLSEIEEVGLQIEELLKTVPGATDIVADRIVGKPYIELNIDRDKIARYGVNIRDVQDVIETAIGGMNLTETVEGRERYPVRVRYLREFREDLPALEKILVPTSTGAQVPITQVVDIETVIGPQEIKGERGLLVGYVTMNTRDRDEVSVVEDAEAVLQAALKDGRLKLPPGTYWEWSGQFENQQRAMARMKILIPLCLLIMFVMLYVSFTRWWIAPIIFFGVLVSASGGFILLGIWGANLSVAVWVGFLVLLGVVDDDGVVMSTYLEQIFKEKKFNSIQEIRQAVIAAGRKRIRPCMMTLATSIFGLLPIFWATGRGSDIMKPMAIPTVGGMIVSLFVTIYIAPALFCAVEEWKWKRKSRERKPQALNH